MTGKERMLAAIKGEPVDRVPIWIREGFEFHHPIPSAADYSLGWRADPEYVALWEFARDHCDMRVSWSPGGHFNRTLAIPPHRMTSETTVVNEYTRRLTSTIDTPKGPLTAVTERRRGENMDWHVKYAVENREDLEKLRSVPFEVDPVSYEQYDREKELVGDRGVMCLNVSSPWVVMASCMPFELALEWSLSENVLLHELLEEITRRTLACLEVVFERDFEDMMANIGGSEQCTPPIMSPDSYEQWVTPYESRVAAFLNAKGVPLNCHCHSHVRGALSSMIEAGMASTDPVEPPSQGNVTIEEARKIAGDRLTLVGNLEWKELVEESPDRIRARVREIIDSGKQRLVMAASAGPVTAMSSKLITNYRTWIEEALDYGVVR